MNYTFDPSENSPLVQTPAQSWSAPGFLLNAYEQHLLAVVRQAEERRATIEDVVIAVEADLAARRRDGSRLLRVVLLISIDRLVRRGLLLREGLDYLTCAPTNSASALAGRA